MVAVPNTNVYLVVIDGGDCPDSTIKCTSVSIAEEFRYVSPRPWKRESKLKLTR